MWLFALFCCCVLQKKKKNNPKWTKTVCGLKSTIYLLLFVLDKALGLISFNLKAVVCIDLISFCCCCFKGVEDFRRHRHPGGLCNQHVLCDCLCDRPEQRAALRFRCSPLSGVSVLRRLPGELFIWWTGNYFPFYFSRQSDSHLKRILKNLSFSTRVM